MGHILKCEVCGKPATVNICDLIENEVREGDSYRTYHPAEDGVHAFCDEHARPPSWGHFPQMNDRIRSGSEN